jgi:glycosyltransferase involved in cell wall biosynthesis
MTYSEAKSDLESAMKVCVAMITYNQAQFIGDAINGVLMQEADFGIQLVIGEDFSTDDTRQICERYAMQYPDKIRLLESTKNHGIQENYFRTIAACLDATYIAFCEGDDVWLDKHKLQHQVGLLEKNRGVLAHAHNAIRRNLITMQDSDFGAREDKELAARDLFTGWPFHDVSLMVRSELLRSIPVNSLPQFISCDRFLNMWIGCHGTMIYEGTKFMAMYRRHQFGASENSNMVLVRQEDLAVLSFFRAYLSNKELYRELKLDAIKSLFFASAALNSPITIPKWPLLLEFMQLASFRQMTNVYHLFLIIFGRPYYRLYEALKKKLANRFLSARIVFPIDEALVMYELIGWPIV